jgi:hydrogenase maturation factor
MGFETVVLEKVAKVLGADNAASFAYGTLFVMALPEDADKVFQMLSADYKNRVEMNACGPEFAYDFI